MLTHLEFDQVRRSLDRMRTTEGSSNSYSKTGTAVEKADVLEILMPYVEGFKPPDPHPKPSVDENPGTKTV